MFNLENRIKPVLKWAGGKSALLPQLVKNFPPKFDRLIEPFVGGGAVFFALAPEVPALINDSNPEVIELYKVVRDTPQQLMTALDRLALFYSEDFYYKLRSVTPENPIDRAARTVFLNKCGFNGLYRQNSKGQFNVPFGKRSVCPLLYDYDNIIRASLHLQKAEIQNVDFEILLNQSGIGDLVYCDPPYEPMTQTASFNTYQASGFSQDDQQRLRDAAARASERGSFVVISNSTSEFIQSLYKEWRVCNVYSKRVINSKGNSRGEILEMLMLREPFTEIPPENSFNKIRDTAFILI